MIKTIRITILATLLTTSASCLAGGDRNVLEEIVVIGSSDDIRHVPGSGTFIDTEQLERFDYVDLHQALGSAPGVYIREEDGYGLRPNIGIRGATPDRSQKITVMEDGVLITPAPYSAPAAYYVPNVIRMDAIEILKGPSAIRHGPHTVGGAINFVTRDTPARRIAEADISAGSDGFRKIQGTYGNRFDRSAYIVDGNHYGGDGFKHLDGGGDTGFIRNEVNLKFQHDFATGLEQRLTLKLGWADEDADETYLGLSDGDFNNNPVRRYAASQLARFQSDHLTLHLNHGIRLTNDLSINTKWYRNEFDREWNKLDGFIDGPALQSVLSQPNFFQTEYQLLTGQTDSTGTDADTLDVTNNDRSFTSTGVQVTARYAFEGDSLRHELRGGIRFHHDEVDRNHKQRGYLMSGGRLIWDGLQRGSKVLNHAETDALSVYVEDVISWQNWNLTLGARHEDIEGERVDRATGTQTTGNQDITNFGAGLYWQVTNNLGLLAGVNEGFSPAAPGATSVDPEESVNFEYGVRYEGDDSRLEMIGFFSDYDNLLGRCRVSDFGCGPGDEFNGGAVEIAGAEITGSTSFTVADNITADLSVVYTYTESAFQDSFLSGFSQWGLVSRGDELPYLPQHVSQVQLGFSGGDWRVWTSVKSRSDMREEPGRGDIDLGLHANGYTTVDFSAMWQLTDNWMAQISVQNAFDEDAIVSHRPFGARPNKPRTIIGRVKFTL